MSSHSWTPKGWQNPDPNLRRCLPVPVSLYFSRMASRRSTNSCGANVGVIAGHSIIPGLNILRNHRALTMSGMSFRHIPWWTIPVGNYTQGDTRPEIQIMWPHDLPSRIPVSAPLYPMYIVTLYNSPMNSWRATGNQALSSLNQSSNTSH